MKKKFSRVAMGSLFFASALVASTVAAPVAQAAVIDVEIGKYTSLDNDYPVVNQTGETKGNFALTAGALAELQIILKGDKLATLKVPEELVGKINPDGDAEVQVGFTIDLTEISLVDQLLTAAETAVGTLAYLIDSQSLFGLKTNFQEVNEALKAFDYLRNLNVSVTSSQITVLDGGEYMQVQFDDATMRFIANKISEAVDNLQAAILAFELSGTGVISSAVAGLIDVALVPVKAIINALLEVVPCIANGFADITKFFGAATMFKESTVTFPTAMDLPMEWFEEFAPNGLTVNFLGTIVEPGILEFEFFEKENNDNVSPVVFADIVKPVTPVIKEIAGDKDTGYTLLVTAEAGSTVNVKDPEGNVIGTAVVPGTADGKTQADVTVTVKGDAVKEGTDCDVTATDAAGNESDAAIAQLGDKVEPVEIFRAYNPNSGEHLYTPSEKEMGEVIAAGWDDEGTAWYATSRGNTVYRLYNPNSGEHFYTLSEKEYEEVAEAGWKKEGSTFFSNEEEEVEIFRVFNPNAQGPGSHHYTVYGEERDGLVDLGWTDEAVAFYGMAVAE
ncbi:hypothetical protein M2139_000397 [Enterococcus sp. PF1-24]|uniref:adhesive domain-containing protein n=1 Tax=unclassified Enterococcus TaxID=2608891 RepID=UPI00247578EF|nr:MULTISPECIES: adhesive domain-containing protein [unclassified Enterococcus]MDH6363422.1 hypothetical protein [Enterococcus sp. PFB1-1]MDH6400516.1 hypothetical protein [Enterococcus sp. PF1-24]